ncbi:zinc ribbon domain-containing protein [Maridesulfovibrio hydrothermalis]|uniref:zinc ribbon domain-containing protein n=1 Tax=Maridesulfovibrio hydrothermalis TaxID=191026 RepID=UPI00031EBD5F|nr:zinc ribbon domain-containing protein [Maridesulfovibrio hydrothermalis]
MITCNKCGKKNNNAAKYCSGCGHKLQSGRHRADDRSGPGGSADMFKITLEKPDIYSKHGEAWVYALFLLGAVIFFTYHRLYWPLYAITPVIALLAWFRKI